MPTHSDVFDNPYISQVLSKISGLSHDPAEFISELLHSYLETATCQKIRGLWSQTNNEKDVKLACDLMRGLKKDRSMRVLTNMLNASPYLPKKGSPLNLLISAFFSVFEAYRPALLKRVVSNLVFEDVWTKIVVNEIENTIEELDDFQKHPRLEYALYPQYDTLDNLRHFATNEQVSKIIKLILPPLDKNIIYYPDRAAYNNREHAYQLLQNLIPQITDTNYWHILETIMNAHYNSLYWHDAVAKVFLCYIPYLTLSERKKIADYLLKNIKEKPSSYYLYWPIIGALKENLTENERSEFFSLLDRQTFHGRTIGPNMEWNNWHEDVMFCRTLPYFKEFLPSEDMIEKITQLLLIDIECYNIDLRVASLDTFKHIVPYILPSKKNTIIAQLLTFLSASINNNSHCYSNMLMRTLHLFKDEMTDDQQYTAVKLLFSKLRYADVDHFSMEDCHTLYLFRDKLTDPEKKQAVSFLLEGLVEVYTPTSTMDNLCSNAACEGLSDFVNSISVPEQERVREKLIKHALSTNSETAREGICQVLRKYCISKEVSYNVFQQIKAALDKSETKANACAVFGLLPELVPFAEKENMTKFFMKCVNTQDEALIRSACLALQQFSPENAFDAVTLLLTKINHSNKKVRQASSKILTSLASQLTLNQQTCLLCELSKRIATSDDDTTLQLYANNLEVYRKTYAKFILNHPLWVDDKHSHTLTFPQEIRTIEIINRAYP